MKADSLTISKVFSSGGDIHYRLPHFQREYSWERPQWDAMIQDALALYDELPEDDTGEQHLEHFLGSLVVINDGTRNGTIPAFKLVDGQQRLITISLLLLAIESLAEAENSTLRKRVRKMLVNADEQNEVFFKVLPTTKYGDRQAYTALVKGPTTYCDSSRIVECFEHIQRKLRARSEIDFDRLYHVITTCFQVVFVDLNQNESPHKIFESLNAKGKPLTQADLVRNYIAMKLPVAAQEEIFSQYWSKLEDLLQERRTVGRSRLGELTAFLRHYLAMRSGVLSSEENVYERFRDRVEKEFPSGALFVPEIATLATFAKHYDSLLRPSGLAGATIREAIIRLNKLETATSYPFLMKALDSKSDDSITEEQLSEILLIVENYIVRRYLAGEPTNYLNKLFPSLWRDVDLANVVESLKDVLLNRGYPSDAKIKKALINRTLYDNSTQSRQKICLILESINRNLSAGSGGFTVLDEAPTIEHILPQAPGEIWQAELGPDWEQTHREWVHTLGNMTLVTKEWNSSLSNSSFKIKRQKLAEHALRLNTDYFNKDIDLWDHQAIEARANFMIDKILEIWPSFGVPKPSSSLVWGPRPRLLRIENEMFQVSTWRDVALETTEYVIRKGVELKEVASKFPYYLKQEGGTENGARQLSNGWWIWLNRSAKNITSYCKRLLQESNLKADAWSVTYEDPKVQSPDSD